VSETLEDKTLEPKIEPKMNMKELRDIESWFCCCLDARQHSVATELSCADCGRERDYGTSVLHLLPRPLTRAQQQEVLRVLELCGRDVLQPLCRMFGSRKTMTKGDCVLFLLDAQAALPPQPTVPAPKSDSTTHELVKSLTSLRDSGHPVLALECADMLFVNADFAHDSRNRGWLLAQVGFCFADLGLASCATYVLAQAIEHTFASVSPEAPDMKLLTDLKMTELAWCMQALEAGLTTAEEVAGRLNMSVAPVATSSERYALWLATQAAVLRAQHRYEEAVDLLLEARQLDNHSVYTFDLVRTWLVSGLTVPDQVWDVCAEAYVTCHDRWQSDRCHGLHVMSQLCRAAGQAKSAQTLSSRAMQACERTREHLRTASFCSDMVQRLRDVALFEIAWWERPATNLCVTPLNPDVWKRFSRDLDLE
jgi:hypothetical protein